MQSLNQHLKEISLLSLQMVKMPFILMTFFFDKVILYGVLCILRDALCDGMTGCLSGEAPQVMFKFFFNVAAGKCATSQNLPDQR